MFSKEPLQGRENDQGIDTIVDRRRFEFIKEKVYKMQ
jgi:hypothetical protein